MNGLIRFLSSLFVAPHKSEPGTPSGHKPGHEAPADSVLEQLSSQLAAASRLLIEPTPDAIRTVALILEEVNAQFLALNPDVVRDESARQVQGFQSQLKRTRSLIEGALRVQWTHMRTLMSLTQSYAPGGKTIHFPSAWPKIDIRI